MNNERILLISYFFNEKGSVAILRSKSLYKNLKKSGYSVEVLHKNFWGINIGSSFLIWSLILFLKIIFSKEKIIYISCGPFLHLPFVVVATKIRKKKLLIDFRDPWSLNIKNGYNQSVKVNKLKLFLSERIEKFSYKNCSSFIICTRGMYDGYHKLFKCDKKLELITNGFDFETDKFEDESKFKGFNVVCLGKFVEYDEEKSILVLERALNMARFRNEELKLHFVGTDEVINLPVLKKLNLISNTKFYPKMEYEEALKIAAKCNMALLVLRNENIEYGTKIFDYIGLGLPILDGFEENSIFRNEFNVFIEKDGNKESVFKYSRNDIFTKKILKLI